MKIMQLCTKVPFPSKDGGAAGIFVFSKAFESDGHAVTLLAVNPPKHFIEEHEYSQLPRNIRIYPVYINTQPHWFSALKNLCFSHQSYHVERFYHDDFVDQLRDLLVKISPDIVQIEGIYMTSYIAVIRQYSKARIVIREHNIEHFLWRQIALNEKNRLKRWYLKIQSHRIGKFEVKHLQQADGVLFFTEEDKQKMLPLCPSLKSIVIPYGVPISEHNVIGSANIKSVYFLGALDWIPNQEAVLWFVKNVWPKIRQNFPAMTCYIAGRNAPLELAERLSQVEGVIFQGEVEDAEMFAEPFSITVVPLFTGSGIRVKIIEAMEQGKVVIASSLAIIGIPAVAGEHLLIADTAGDYCAHLQDLWSSPEKMQIIQQNARKFIKDHYDIKKISSKLIQFYNELDD